MEMIGHIRAGQVTDTGETHNIHFKGGKKNTINRGNLNQSRENATFKIKQETLLTQWILENLTLEPRNISQDIPLEPYHQK